MSGSAAVSDDLIIVDLSRDTVVSVIVTYTVIMSLISQGSVCSSSYQHWSRINKPILFRSVKWPKGICSCYHMCEWAITSDSGRGLGEVLSVTVGLVSSPQS